MTHDELERAMEFLLIQQVKSSSESESLRATVSELTGKVSDLTDNVAALTANLTQLTVIVDDMREEMREGFNNLIVANEVTRDLANKIAGCQQLA